MPPILVERAMQFLQDGFGCASWACMRYYEISLSGRISGNKCDWQTDKWPNLHVATALNVMG